ncbi:MAG TPA: DUF3800 domain-containing protein [Longimicrobiaceae bacterium]|nr:DUF3800 domain-containing protein [Longimicrobiaceae bacterium]
MPSFDDYIVFVDESGDHGLDSIDRNYPVFVLAFCIFQKESYCSRAVPAVLRFKFKYFGHDQAILHERDIRRGYPPFAFTRDRNIRDEFFADLNKLVADADFRLVASVIRKEDYRTRYGVFENPYHIAMGFGLERVFLELHGLGCRDGRTYVICERRGAPEDEQLKLEIRRVCDNNATVEFCRSSRCSFPSNATPADFNSQTWLRGRSGARSSNQHNRTGRTISSRANSGGTGTGEWRGGD